MRLKIIGGAVGVLALVVVGALGFVAIQPSEIVVSRSIEVNASPKDVVPFATDLKQMGRWSPWTELDPDLKQTYSDNPVGKDAWYSWSGDENVGAGKQTITLVEPEKVVMHLEFQEPFVGEADSTISWTGDANTTTITWRFHEDADFTTKAVELFMSISGMVSDDYDRGLAKLKPLVESAGEKRRIKVQAAKKATEAAEMAAQAAKIAADAAKAASEAAAQAAALQAELE